MALDISTFVDVNTQITVGGVPRTAFGIGLLITTDDTLPAGGPTKARLFNNIAAVQDVFSAGDPLDAATVWFSADPPPKSLMIGRWASADVSTTLRGGDPSAAAASPLNTANASFRINDQNVTVDLSSASTYAEIATAIQTAIQALGGIYAAATFVYDTDAFLLVLTGGDDAITGGVFTNAVDVNGMQTGTDISVALGMTASESPEYKQGHDAETVVSAVGEMVALATSGDPVALMIDEGVPETAGTVDTRQSLAAFAQAGDYVFALLDTADQALVAGDTTSLIAQALGLQQSQVPAIYSIAGEKPDISLLALMSSQNLDNAASIITPNAKALPGVLPSPVNDAQAAELKRKRANVYANVAGLPSFVGGYTSRNGHWLDAVWWLLWMKARLETDVWNAQRGARRFTNAQLLDALIGAMQAGVSNGGLQPGRRVNASTKADIIQTTRNTNFGGVLTQGYVVHVERNRAAVDIENRNGRFKIWGIGSEAIHNVFGDLVFQN